MSFLNHLSIRAKLFALIALALLALTLSTALLLNAKRHTLMEERQRAVRSAVETAWSSIDALQRQAAAGTLSEAEAKQRAIQTVASARYGTQDYFWINDLEPRMVVHPMKPELNGQPLGQTRDPDGRALFTEMAKIAQRDGAGFFSYRWPRPGSDTPVPKVSYVKGIPAWGWLVGSGIYTDDVDTAFWADVRETSAWLAGIAGLLVVAGALLTRNLSRRVGQAVHFADAIAAGDLGQSASATGRDEVARLLQALETMRGNLQERVSADHLVMVGNQRVLSALDAARTNIRIVDNDGTVIYINNALRSTLRELTPRLRETIPDFTADSLIGRSIGIFYADPAAALQRLRGITGTTNTRMEIGGRTFDVVTNPIFDAAGVRLGTVGEWVDRTDQLRVEQELSTLIEGASNGEYGLRIDPHGKQGFYLDLAQMLNRLMENTESGIDEAARVMAAMAEGDLTAQMAGNYQGSLGRLRDDTNTTVDRLREVLGQIQDASHVIHTASREIASGNNDLSVRTERQASGVEEMASAIEEINATMRRNADNARQANELAHESAQSTEQGGRQMSELVTSMGAIQDSSRRIGEIVGVIDSIAFQTNILALNAAVEAARAGEEGRGFSVVAAEVRELAQRSASAAKEIKTLISSSGEHVDQGARLVKDTGSTIQRVVDSFREVRRFVSEIATASVEQSVGVEKVGRAISDMDDTTQKNAALVEQATAAAHSLEEQASALVDAVSMFSLTEHTQRG